MRGGLGDLGASLAAATAFQKRAAKTDSGDDGGDNAPNAKSTAAKTAPAAATSIPPKSAKANVFGDLPKATSQPPAKKVAAGEEHLIFLV